MVCLYIIFIPSLTSGWGEIFGISGPCRMGQCIFQCSFYSLLELDILLGIATFRGFFFQRGMVDLCWLNYVVLRLAMLEYMGVCHIQAVMVMKCFKH
jgi:hypothetical protein